MKFDINAMQKKGQVAFGGSMDKAITVLLVVVLVGALAPTMFETNWSAITGAPSWVGTIIPILIGVAIIYLIYKQVK